MPLWFSHRRYWGAPRKNSLRYSTSTIAFYGHFTTFGLGKLYIFKYGLQLFQFCTKYCQITSILSVFEKGTINKQKNLGFEVQTWKYQRKCSKMCVIFPHFHFSTWTFFMQRKNLQGKLPIQGTQKLPKLFSFNLKQMLWQSDVYFRFYQLQSVPTPPKVT